jgi:GTPase
MDALSLSEIRTPEVEATPFRCGYVAIIGRPNVGKSTLLNTLIAAKVSITSARAQTTRHRILGILTKEHAQLVFFDTPGYQTQHKNALNKVLNRTVRQTAGDADVVVFVCDAHGWTAADDAILQLISPEQKVILAVNKVDTVKDAPRLAAMFSAVSAKFRFEELIPISGKSGHQLDVLIEQIRKRLPEQEAMFEADMFTDRSERFLASELIREKLFRLVGDELPYESTVVIEQFEELDRLRRVFATILVQREGHKPIVLGQNGERIKQIAQGARIDMERLFDCKVHLELWVKVKGGWADNEQSLRAYGYE